MTNAGARPKRGGWHSLDSPRCSMTRKERNAPACGVASVGVATLLLALTALLPIALLAYQLSASTKRGREEFWGEATAALPIHSHTLQHVKEGYFVRGTSVLTILWWWGVPLLTTLTSIALLQLPARRVVFRKLRWLRRLLSSEVRVGKWVACESVLARGAGISSFTVGEALMYVVLLVVNVMAGQRVYKRFLAKAAVLEGADDDYERVPEWAKRWDALNFALGYASFANFALIFFPVARNSPLFDLMGLSFEKRIKYHRWLSHFSLWVVTAHGLSYWLLWLVRSEWVEMTFEQGDPINHFAGVISIFFGWSLWITAREFFRRRFFEVFYRFHIVCFLGFATFANLHVPVYTLYLPAGLLLYAVDVVLRVVQQSVPVEVETSVNSDGTIVGLTVEAQKGLTTIGSPIVWISCPSISRCQWHPVTPIISSNGHLRVFFKVYGKWTKELCAKGTSGRLARVHIEGPHDVGSDGLVSHFMEYSSLVFFAGGNAITPVLSILEAINSADVGIEQSKPSIYVYWTVRREGELEAGLPLLRNFMRQQPDILALEIYITDKKNICKQRTLPRVDEKPCLSARIKKTLSSLIGRAPTPVLVLAKQGPLHLSITYIVAYGAGFAGLILGRALTLEYLLAGETLKRGHNNILQFTLTIVMAIGWITLCILPLHILNTARARRGTKWQSAMKNLCSKSSIGGTFNSMDEETQEQRHIGRPNIGSILQTLETGGIDKNSTAVLAGGPTALVTAVRKASLSNNFEFHETSFEL